jgi:hypothetical protein
VVDRWAFRHTEQDLLGALERLARLAERAALPVIIERSSGLVVERLLAVGHPLRTDGHRLRRLDPPDVGLQELQALVRLREDHVRARTAASMKLGALLEAHWPGPKAVFFRLVSPIALAFPTDYPTPGRGPARPSPHGQLLPPPQLSRRQDPAQLLVRLHSAPTAPVGIPAATLAILVRAQVELLRTLLGTIAELEAAIATRVAASPRAHLLAALPGVGTINLAQLLAEVGRSLTASTAPSRPPPNAARHRSPRPPARPPASPSVGPPTGGPARS